MPIERTADQQTKVLMDKFVRMLPGQSFFVADVTVKDMAFMRRPAMVAGCGIRIVNVECDEIYQQQGVRVWRELGTYDDL